MDYSDLFSDVQAAVNTPRTHALRAETNPWSDEQRIALESPFSKSAVVVAGAGAGKTKLLVARAAALVKAGADPQRVAVVTFTRKAAAEIQSRLLSEFGSRTMLPVCGTVHSLALSRLASQKDMPTIANDDELTYFLDLLRDELPESYSDLSDGELLLQLNRVREEERTDSIESLIAARFEEMLEEEEVVDFTLLLRSAATKLRAHFDYVLVDEAQDLSSLQKVFLRKIGRKNSRYWFIGDGDQAIYAFRGAHGGVMQELKAECDETFVLSTNYRSSTAIIRHANNVISKNKGRFDIQWRPYRMDEGTVQVEHFAHGEDEVEAARKWLEGSQGRAVLARTQAIIAPLRELGLPAFTVHESKGLEWSQVWVMGCETSLFPHALGIKEEERRLFYVAMTRAKDYLRMSYCSSRAQNTKKPAGRHPSPFLYEAQSLDG